MNRKLLLRLAAMLLLCAIALPTLFSCSAKDAEVPEGMQSATCHGEDFRLYIPTHWNVNTAYGVSGGYYNLSKQSTVSVVKYPVTDALLAQMTLEGADMSKPEVRFQRFFETQLKPEVANLASGGVKMVEKECLAGLLNGQNAWQFRYSATVGGVALEFYQILCEHKGAFYVFSFTAITELYEILLNDVTRMLDNFRFADEPYVAPYLKHVDANAQAPEGMQLASGEEVSYRFYVPKSWKVSPDERIYAAYVEKDKSSVSVVPYMPTAEGISIVGYFEQSEAMLKKISGGKYERISSEEIKVAGRSAMRYEYTLTLGGIDYRYLQIVTGYKSMVYSLTYTARAECFADHLDDVNAIFDAFTFR